MTSTTGGRRTGGTPVRSVRRRHLALAVAAMTMAAPLVGCAAGDRSAAGAGATATTVATQALPVALVAAADAHPAAAALAALRPDLEVVGAAESVLVGDCARQAGYPVRPGDPVAQPDPQTFATFPSPTPEAAARSGYGIAERVLTAQTAADRQAWDASPEDYKAGITLVVFGDPEKQVTVTFDDGYTARIGADGCYADVRRDLYGDLTEYARQSWAASQAFGRTAAALTASDAWATARTAWSACMAAAGHPGYGSSGDVRIDLFQRVAAIEVTSPQDRVEQYRQLAETERALAGPDAACARSTGLQDVWVDTVAAADPNLAAQSATITAWAERLARIAPQARDRAVTAAAT